MRAVESKSRAYVIRLAYGGYKTKKKVKVEGSTEPMFQLVPILGVGVVVDGELKAFVPLVELETSDADQLFGKYGVEKRAVTALVREIAEETKSEKELYLE